MIDLKFQNVFPKILSTIPLVAIHGLDGGADTGTDLDRGILKINFFFGGGGNLNNNN